MSVFEDASPSTVPLASDALLDSLVSAYRSLTADDGPRVAVVRVLAETGHGKTYAVQRLHDVLADEACRDGKTFYPPSLASANLPANRDDLTRSRQLVRNINDHVLGAARAFTWLGVACGQNRSGTVDDDLQDLVKQLQHHQTVDFKASDRLTRAGRGAGRIAEGTSELVLTGAHMIGSVLKIVDGGATILKDVRATDVQDFEDLDLEQAKEQAELFQALLTRTLDAERPTIVVIDDAHNASVGLTLALERLVRAATQANPFERFEAPTSSTEGGGAAYNSILIPRFPLLIVTTEWSHIAERQSGEGVVFRRWVEHLENEQPQIDFLALYAGQLSDDRAKALLEDHDLPQPLVDALLEPFSAEEGVNAYTLAIRLSSLVESGYDAASRDDPERLDYLCRLIVESFPRSPQDTVRKWFERLDKDVQAAVRLGARFGRSFPVMLAAKGSSETAALLDRAADESGFLQQGDGYDAPPGSEAHLLRTVALNDLTYGWLADDSPSVAGVDDPWLLDAVAGFVRSHLSAIASSPLRTFLPMGPRERSALLQDVWRVAERAGNRDSTAALAAKWMLHPWGCDEMLPSIEGAEPDEQRLLAAAVVCRRRHGAWEWMKGVVTAGTAVDTPASTLRLVMTTIGPAVDEVAELRGLAEVPGWGGVVAAAAAISALMAAGERAEAVGLLRARIERHPYGIRRLVLTAAATLAADPRSRGEAIEVMRPLAATDPEVAMRLAGLIDEQPGGRGEALEVLRPLAATSAPVALRLSELLVGSPGGRGEALEVLRPLAATSVPVALRLSELLAGSPGGRGEAIAVLRPLAGSDIQVAVHLARLLAGSPGGRGEAIAVLRPLVGSDVQVAVHLARLLAESSHGRAEAIAVLRPLSRVDVQVAVHLSGLLAESSGGRAEAIAVLRPFALTQANVAMRLVRLLAEEPEGRAEAIELLRPLAETDVQVALRLSELLAEQPDGREEALEVLRPLARSHGGAAMRLAGLFMEELDGRESAIAVLRPLAGTDGSVAVRLSELVAQEPDGPAKAIELLRPLAGSDAYVAVRLSELLVEESGGREEAIDVLLRLAPANEKVAMRLLAMIAEESALRDEAMSVLRPVADTNANVAMHLSRLLVEHPAQRDEAFAVLQPHVPGVPAAIRLLCYLVVRERRPEHLESLVANASDLGVANLCLVADSLAAAGDVNSAVLLLRDANERGNQLVHQRRWLIGVARPRTGMPVHLRPLSERQDHHWKFVDTALLWLSALAPGRSLRNLRAIAAVTPRIAVYTLAARLLCGHDVHASTLLPHRLLTEAIVRAAAAEVDALDEEQVGSYPLVMAITPLQGRSEALRIAFVELVVLMQAREHAAGALEALAVAAEGAAALTDDTVRTRLVERISHWEPYLRRLL